MGKMDRMATGAVRRVEGAFPCSNYRNALAVGEIASRETVAKTIHRMIRSFILCACKLRKRSGLKALEHQCFTLREVRGRSTAHYAATRF